MTVPALPAAEPGLSDPIPVFLLTGFLGSGKTTLLNRMLADGGPCTGIVVNEYGDVAIDNDLVQVEGEERSLTRTSNGCICCTPGSDIVSALGQLSEALDDGGIAFVDRVVVETTGLADPAPIINQLISMAQYRIAGRLFALAGVIATPDAVCGAETVEERYIGHKQLAFADRIALTKTDLLGHDAAGRRDALHALVARLL